MNFDISLITLNNLNIKSIIRSIHQYGICIFPQYLSADKLLSLNREFDLVHESNANYIKHIDYSNGKGAVFSLWDADENEFPTTCRIFKQELFGKLSQDYLGNHILNKEVYVVNDVIGTSHHANDLHFDVASTFKFFIYLTDTTSENGAFTCIPGSQIETKIIREKYQDDVSYENRNLTRDLPIEKFAPEVPIEGPAGTLIIFDTDVWHKAGKVSKGERKVMRGHTRAVNNANLKSEQGFLKKLISKFTS